MKFIWNKKFCSSSCRWLFSIRVYNKNFFTTITMLEYWFLSLQYQFIACSSNSLRPVTHILCQKSFFVPFLVWVLKIAGCSSSPVDCFVAFWKQNKHHLLRNLIRNKGKVFQTAFKWTDFFEELWLFTMYTHDTTTSMQHCFHVILNYHVIQNVSQ